jgi:sulfoxide reductase heme-binding subunit YedZ
MIRHATYALCRERHLSRERYGRRGGASIPRSNTLLEFQVLLALKSGSNLGDRMISSRLIRRIVWHHLPIGAATVTWASYLYTTRDFPDVITRLSFSTAYPALALLASTLLIGPLQLMAKNRVAASIDFRRDLGIWAAITGLFHAGVGQFVHLRGRPWLYYIYENWQQTRLFPLRHDLFGLANYTGLVAALILIALLATSNDASLRALRVPGWKRLQRWNYVIFGLVAIHTLIYQVAIERPGVSFIANAVALITISLLFQWRGYQHRRDSTHARDNGNAAKVSSSGA